MRAERTHGGDGLSETSKTSRTRCPSRARRRERDEPGAATRPPLPRSRGPRPRPRLRPRHARPAADAEAARTRRDQRRAVHDRRLQSVGVERDPRRDGDRDRRGEQGTGATASADAASCEVIPEETAGPFPGDGSNGPDVLSQSGVVRKDIRSSFGSSTTVAEGVPLTIQLDRSRTPRTAPRSRRGRLRLALRPATATTRCTRRASAERELPARRPGGRRRRRRDVHEHLPGLLPGPLAAHPLRGLPEPRDRDRRGEQDRHLPDRAARRTPATTVYATAGYEQSVRPLARQPRGRQRLRRRRRRAASWAPPAATSRAATSSA